jgi:3-oxoacyl-[acyl-carrier protein] reductase
MRLKGKVAIVTGGGQGIGKQTSLTFAREGAKVAVVDMKAEAVEQVVKEITDAGGEAKAVVLNVTDAAAVSAAMAEIKEWGGSLDVLVNNAGITRDARMVKMTEEQFDAVINVNLKGVWICAQAAAHIMTEQGSGSIISTASLVALYGNFGQTNYVATKAGVIGMTKTWARELGPKGVRVNAVAPGFIQTDMIATVPDKVLDSIKEKTPIRRLGTAQDIANAFLFLASDESTFVTGTVLSVDGGFVG